MSVIKENHELFIPCSINSVDIMNAFQLTVWTVHGHNRLRLTYEAIHSDIPTLQSSSRPFQNRLICLQRAPALLTELQSAAQPQGPQSVWGVESSPPERSHGPAGQRGRQQHCLLSITECCYVTHTARGLRTGPLWAYGGPTHSWSWARRTHQGYFSC